MVLKLLDCQHEFNWQKAKAYHQTGLLACIELCLVGAPMIFLL